MQLLTRTTSKRFHGILVNRRVKNNLHFPISFTISFNSTKNICVTKNGTNVDCQQKSSIKLTTHTHTHKRERVSSIGNWVINTKNALKCSIWYVLPIWFNWTLETKADTIQFCQTFLWFADCECIAYYFEFLGIAYLFTFRDSNIYQDCYPWGIGLIFLTILHILWIKHYVAIFIESKSLICSNQ